MPSVNISSTTPGIYFGFKSALQIARAVGINNLTQECRATYKLPDRAAKQNQIALAMKYLESEYPLLEITKPASLLIGSTSRPRNTKLCEIHSCTSELSRGSFYKVADGIFVATPALSLMQLATRDKNMISLLEYAYELCGTYQDHRTAATSLYQVPPLTSVRALQSYALRNKPVNGAQKVLRALRYVSDNAASPRETKLALVLGLPHMHGGYGLGIPRMNHKVLANCTARATTGKSHFRCDLCWPEAKLDVEYQSSENHAGEAMRIKDSLRTNALTAMGWTVISITNAELNSLASMDAIANTIRRTIGKHTQVRVSDYHKRKLKLRQQLGLPFMHEQYY